MEHARYSSSQQLPFTTNIHEKVTKGKKNEKNKERPRSMKEQKQHELGKN
jgi:hypothetical protein